MSKLQGKVALVTGGSSGMGLATAKRFVEEGAFVYITGRRQTELDKAVSLIGRSVAAVQGDVSNLADLDRLYAKVASEKGKIDILFAGAGIVDPQPLAGTTEESFDRVFAINTRGLAFTVKKALPLLNDGGAIIVITSIAENKGIPGFTAYSATKAAVRSFVRTWTAELKDRRIRVNAISPGPIDTPIFEQQAPAPNDAHLLALHQVPGQLPDEFQGVLCRAGLPRSHCFVVCPHRLLNEPGLRHVGWVLAHHGRQLPCFLHRTDQDRHPRCLAYNRQSGDTARYGRHRRSAVAPAP